MEPEFNILVVDDNPSDAVYIKRLLKKIPQWSVIIEFAESGDEGVEKLKSFQPDIVFIDYLLGTESGIEVINKFKQVGSFAYFILLTGYGSETVVTDALRAGASDYLNKGELTPEILDRTLRHIQQKIESDKKLRQTELQLQEVIRNTDTGLVVIDTSGIVIQANEPYRKLIGMRSTDDICGKNISSWTVPESRDSFQQAIQNCLSFGYVQNHETLYKSIDNSIVYVLINATRDTDRDGNTIITALCRNITERKLYEKELKAAKERAEESDRLKSAFLANISHEIRTPMNAIIGFTNLLLNSELVPEKKMRLSGFINESCSSLLQTINDILDLSLIESGKFSFINEKHSLTKILQDIYEYNLEILAQMKSSNLTLILDSITPDDLCIECDANRLKQVFANLLDNAFKFTEEGTINFGMFEEGERFIFYVFDTGVGIAPENHEQIFNRFQKIQVDKSKFHSGTGLGLPISKNIIKLMGGDMWLSSNIGKGSKFYFSVPKVIGNSSDSFQSVDGDADTDYNWLGKQILVVEDEYTNYVYLEELLSPTQISVLHAKDGQEAIDMFHMNDNIDIVLMDMKLPVIDGYAATKSIKKHRQDIPVIAQTAYAMSTDRETILEHGCDDYIAKPILSNELLLKINTWLVKE